MLAFIMCEPYCMFDPQDLHMGWKMDAESFLDFSPAVWNSWPLCLGKNDFWSEWWNIVENEDILVTYRDIQSFIYIFSHFFFTENFLKKKKEEM